MRVGTSACAVVAPLLIAATEPVRLKPSSKWMLEYAENSCRLTRTFGEGESKTVLLFESNAPGDLDMLAVGKPLRTKVTEVPARFLPVQQRPSVGEPAKSAQGGQPAILWTNVILLPDSLRARAEKREADAEGTSAVRPPPINPAERAAELASRQEFASAATELEIKSRLYQSVILETGSLGKPIKAFDKCSRESLRSWGVDPDLEDKIVRPVWAQNPAQWFRSEDYPRSMQKKGKESTISARLLVDPTGKVTKCTSLSHFDAPEFNNVVCDRFMTRASFQPAELPDGTKVPSYFTVRVVFRLSS